MICFQVQSEPFVVVYEYLALLNIGKSSLKKQKNKIYLFALELNIITWRFQLQPNK